MRIIHGLRDMAPLDEPVVVTIGTFDGVHVGHQAILQRVVETARARDAASVVITFEPHPRVVLGRPEEGLLLTSAAHKLQLIAAQGVDLCVVVRFDRTLADIDAEAFVRDLLAGRFRLQAVVIGATSRFGKNASGDARFLQQCGVGMGFDVEVVEPVRVDDMIVNSTVIRTLVQGGELDQAAAFLGRPFSLLGTVVQGATRGRRIGYPTANLDPTNEVVPPCGVYVVRVRLGGRDRLAGRELGGVLNVGLRPTFEDPDQVSRAIEVHILDFDELIYGRELEVIFCRKLREERRFESVELLREQIRRDVLDTREVLGMPPEGPAQR
ncbi:MAG: bifunctional riboflavin kinase/FAD synthetase [Verrucomicrobia bacterium]|nr:bifunctional riboflavin kinase/FAD synthetase [Verrucomicrobiota bacterium]